ncbi:MAG: hypothetical protein ABF780_05660 [Bifidobacterium aquikefiri]|uniref:Tail fiber protein n=1 Tax=Bifidobacterium aquikefiri TaxID=1653207 RepID=A0A261G288_9BIFI|nr:hypothetical protein [Bifidobacterium aquikefiri]OZG65551.1 hypothetical protein BAQU_1734 [Bifidobacterium aquikefiri]
MPTIGNNLLPYPNSSDAPNVPSDLSKLAQAVDTAIGGGCHIIQTHADLLAIPSAQLFTGMRVYVIADSDPLNNDDYMYLNGAWSHARPTMQTGNIPVVKNGIAAGSFLQRHVTFTHNYAAVPNVWGDGGDTIFTVSTKNVAIDGFDMFIRNNSSAANTLNIYPRWYAYGTLA